MEAEKRRDSLSVLKICRFCLSQDDTLQSIYTALKPKKGLSLSMKILSCLSVEVFPSDHMPRFICKPCLFFMELFYNYKEICRKADERMLMHIQSLALLETIPWPSLLTKVYRLGSQIVPDLMTVVGGATVQVTSQDGSDSDDEYDDANVYDVKIDDELGEGTKHIKVIASNEGTGKTNARKVSQEDLSHEADSDGQEGTLVKAKGYDRSMVWPCDQCHYTFPLKQLLQLHLKTKHRSRTVSCDKRDQNFFSSSELAFHQIVHNDEMLFRCAACDAKFKRLVHLKRHERVMHSEIPQRACQLCPATFLSLKELDAHQSRHSIVQTQSFPCHTCNKSFINLSRLQKHMETIHHQNSELRCEYCPAQFSSITKLTKHVRTHAGTRSYPCKYCHKTFVKSHHYTRHLRIKHRAENQREGRRRAASASAEQYRCEQCFEAFESQDELIYHSAIHATQDLTCPLCQEKFLDVDAVTSHIKSHVNGMEFMCDLCELVFTTKEKLDMHLTAAHADELEQDDSSMEVEGEEDEDESGINVTEENGEMVVEIKKTDNFMLPEKQTTTVEKPETSLFEESEAEPTYTESATADTLASTQQPVKTESDTTVEETAIITKIAPKPVEPIADSQTANILRKAEEMKRKVRQIADEPEKQPKVKKVESSNPVSGASEKSLRLLEKELQELKRTNTRSEIIKTPAKPIENVRNRRPQLHTSTPKTRAVEQKKEISSVKTPAVEKKVIERKIVTKENKEPKEAKDAKAHAPLLKEEKTTREEKPTREEKREESKEKTIREEKKEEAKEKDTPKSAVKNGQNEISQPEENVRRSTRPSKIKDYAKMIRDKSQDSDDDSDDAKDEEYKEVEKTETRAKTRRSSIKVPAAKPAVSPAAPPATPATPATAPRKRGRPRKEVKEVPAKLKKDEVEEDEEVNKDEDKDKTEAEQTSKKPTPPVQKEMKTEDNSAGSEPMDTATPTKDIQSSPTDQKSSPSSNLLMSPSGQTLKKVPIRALPPGVKPLPLPSHARPMGPGELCEMQIGKKVVKVQKIVMTKAEVEAMAKKGLVEMKDGTMVLKQGIKLPSSDLSSLVPNLGDKGVSKESPKTENVSNTQSNTSEKPF